MAAKGLRARLIRSILFVFIVLSFSALPAVMAQEEAAHAVGVELVAEGLTAPVAMATPNDGSGRIFIVDQAGMIRVLTPDAGLLPDPFLDLTGLIIPLRTDYDERGVLGLAFHPDYANNGRFFVYYTAPLRAEAPAGWDHTNVVAEFNVSADNPNAGDLASQKTVLQIDQPQFNHNAGHIAFGPDGYLYVPIGDGGGANDTDEGHTPGLGNGQDLTNIHGSILRIDVNGEPGSYTIPADNPFAAPDDNMADEIYAYGFRNPYDISFDRGGSNQLFAADAGQDAYEEVDIVTLGGNYGWNIKEGTHCFNAPAPDQMITDCASTGAMGEPLIDPIIEYTHDVGLVVVGGHVYRGTAMPELDGYYILGDYTASQDFAPDGSVFWAEPSAEGGMWEWGQFQIAGTENGRIGGYVLALGQDESGEIYVMTSQNSAPTGDTGKVWKLVPGTASEMGGEAAPGSTEEPMATQEASG